jgi:hypothetical protein
MHRLCRRPPSPAVAYLLGYTGTVPDPRAGGRRVGVHPWAARVGGRRPDGDAWLEVPCVLLESRPVGLGLVATVSVAGEPELEVPAAGDAALAPGPSSLWLRDPPVWDARA